MRNLLRCALTAVLLVVSAAVPVSAQTVADPTTVEFAPSADHAVTLSDGTPMLQSYRLSIYQAGTAQAVQVAALGKPAPQPDGLIRVAFLSLLSPPLASGVTYEARVEAVGPGGVTPSALTNTFTFSPPSVPAVDCVMSDWSCGAWSGWTAVSATTEQRTRTCTRSVVTPASGTGLACPADLTQVETETRPITVPTADTAPPAVVSASVSQSGRSRNFSAAARAQDDTALAQLVFRVDGAQVGLCAVAGRDASCSVAFVYGGGYGAHTLTVQARDAAGNLSLIRSWPFTRR